MYLAGAKYPYTLSSTFTAEVDATTVPNPHTGVTPYFFGEMVAVSGASWKSKYLAEDEDCEL